METRTSYYETEGMAKLRELLEKMGHSNESINSFKACLISLENQGFTLSKNLKASEK